MLTQAEAEDKWCPFSRIAAEERGAPTMNRFNEVSSRIPRGAHCIGSGCMAWRWQHRDPIMRDEPARGYCGLAGRPE